MFSRISSFFKKEGTKFKTESAGWVNLYQRECGGFRLSGGNTYKTKDLAEAVRRGSYTESTFIDTVEVFVKIPIKGKHNEN